MPTFTQSELSSAFMADPYARTVDGADGLTLHRDGRAYVFARASMAREEGWRCVGVSAGQVAYPAADVVILEDAQ